MQASLSVDAPTSLSIKCSMVLYVFASLLSVTAVSVHDAVHIDSASSPASECRKDLQDDDGIRLLQKHLQVESSIAPRIPGMNREGYNHVVDHSNDYDFETLHEVQTMIPSAFSIEFSSPNETGTYTDLYTVKDLKGCPVCDPQSDDTCGRCFKVGNGHWLDEYEGGSHLFEVQNVLMKNGTAVWVGQHADKISDCGQRCGPTWEMWPPPDKSWASYFDAPSDSEHLRTPEGAHCSPDDVKTQPVLIAVWIFPTNVYHFYMQTVFSVFMTKAHIAEIRGCEEEAIEVYIASGKVDTPFQPLWDAFVENGGIMTEMNGCYKHVFFGQMSSDYLFVDSYTTYDPTLSSWMTAFRANARSMLVGGSSVSMFSTAFATPVFLLVHHDRAPDWMNDITWGIDGVEVKPVNFAKLKILDQFNTAASANGFIGISGSGLAQQIFLPVGSSILQANILEPTGYDRECGLLIRDTDNAPQLEGNARCYGNTAVHIGNTLLNWRWCSPHSITNATAGAGFSSQDAQAVMKLLLLETQKASDSQTARLCTVINEKTSVEAWPRCDSLVVAPILHPTRKCATSGLVGNPFHRKGNRTVIKYCLSEAYCI